MSSRNWRLRVQDILNAISSIQKSTANMTHEYFQVDLEVVWDSIHNDLFQLAFQFQNLLESKSNKEE